MRGKQFRLYNILFPAWMFTLLPPMWLVIIPGNFAIDSLVLLISLWAMKIADKKQWYKRHILKIFIFGFLADIIGSALLLLLLALVGDPVVEWGSELFFTITATIVSGLMIYIFNYFFTFKKSEKTLRFKLSLIFAIATAPYTFLIPTSWIY